MLAPNTLLQSRYRIISLINQGNMGAVYLAEDIRLGNEVALKETFAAGGDAALRDQFHREARLLSRLRHPALPRVIDHFIDGNGQFLVMDYITGKDLKESLEEQGGPFPVNKVLDWADQLLDVLTYLHAQDEPVIHRDIKPANIKLTPKGKVMLLDFGLAKGASSSLLLSLPAATMGYAPIEQIMALGTDGRSDLYALGVTLYHLLTNTLPPTALQRRDAVWQGQPDPLVPAIHFDPSVPAAISQVLTRAMSLQANDRPANASEMRRMLSDAKGSEQPTLIAPAAPERATIPPIVYDLRKENDPPVINRPPPVDVNLSIQKAQADKLVARTELQTQQPQPATLPHPIPATEAASLPEFARKRNRPLWMILGIVALLIVGIVVFAVIISKKPSMTNNTAETTGAATPPTSKAARPAMKPFDFNMMTVNARGVITDGRKGLARYFAEDLGGGVTLDMVEIPDGEFEMGSSDAFAAIVRKENQRIGGSVAAMASMYSEWERKQHKVKVPTFYMGKFEVTQAQWLAVAELPKVEIEMDRFPSKFTGGNLPVERVSRNEAVEFCARLSKARGREYRLPSEAEWEYACRAGTTTPFAFGETITPEVVNYEGGHPYGRFAPTGEDRRYTTEVGSFGYANGFGLYDMHGNVWEWCLDSWHKNYNNEAPTDGSAWISGKEMAYGVMRGGSWDYVANFCRSASRLKVPVSAKDYRYGFRVVTVAEPR